MTLQAFLDKLGQIEGWYLRRVEPYPNWVRWEIRRDIPESLAEYPRSPQRQCPLTAVANHPSVLYHRAGVELGLSEDDVQDIVNAADQQPKYLVNLRAQLLHACHLTEGSR